MSKDKYKTEYSELSDDSLLSLISDGDLFAEETMLTRYRQKVKSVSRSYYIFGGDNEDLIQEGMIGLMKAIRSYSPDLGASFNTYATRCVINQLKSAVRSDSRLKNVPLNSGVSLDELLTYENSENRFFSSSELTLNPEETVLAHEISEEAMAKYFSYLSDYEKSVLLLYLVGFSSSEIAKRLSKSTKSVDNAVSRVKTKIMRQINTGDISKS